MISNWWNVLLFVVVQLTFKAETLVPYTGVVRSKPKWWTKVHTDGDCWASSDCSPDECCIRPTGSSHSFCHELRQPGESCRLHLPLVLGIPASRRVYSDLCPCIPGYDCRELGTGWVHAECAPPKGTKSTKEALRLRRSFRRTILQFLLNKRTAAADASVM